MWYIKMMIAVVSASIFHLSNTYVIFLLVAVESGRVVCRISKILDLARGKCHMPNCSSVYTVSYETRGCALVVHGLCENGHKLYWTSSCQTANNNGDKLHEDNLLFAMAVTLSGNNYSKLEQFCKILNLYIICRTTFHMYQRLYICPGIDKFYCREQVNYCITTFCNEILF